MRRRPSKVQPQVPPTPAVPGFWVSLRERKVVQWTLAYAAAATALLQLLVLVAEQFAWPLLVGQSAIVALACGLPVAIVVAWYHGDRGQQRITGGELLWLALILALGAALLWWLPRAPADEATAGGVAAPAADAPRRHRIAVLPLANLSPDPQNGYFADGLHDELLRALGTLGTVEVVSLTTMRSFRDSTLPARRIAEELQASHVLEGSVRRDGDRMHMSLRLVDADADRPLWSETYTRAVGNALALQTEIAVAVARRLGDRVSPWADALATVDPRAVEFYLQSRMLQDSRTGSMRQRRELLDAALTLAPAFGLARAERADALAMLHFHAGVPREDIEAQARDDLAAARRLAPDQPATHLAEIRVRYYVDRDYAGALALADAALVRWPLDSGLLAVRGYLCNRLGRSDEAIEALKQAIRLDPLNTDHMFELRLQMENVRRDYPASWQLAQRMHRLNPSAGNRRALARAGFLLTGDVPAYAAALVEVAGLFRTEGDETSALFNELLVAEYRGQWADASALLAQSGLDGEPRNGGNLLPAALMQQYFHVRMGREAEAARYYHDALAALTAQRAEAKNPVWVQAWIAQAHALAGNESEARAALASVSTQLDANVDAVIAANARITMARVLALLGDDAACIDLLRELLRTPHGVHAADVLSDSMTEWALGDSPHYAPLRRELRAQVESQRRRFALLQAQAREAGVSGP